MYLIAKSTWHILEYFSLDKNYPKFDFLLSIVSALLTCYHLIIILLVETISTAFPYYPRIISKTGESQDCPAHDLKPMAIFRRHLHSMTIRLRLGSKVSPEPFTPNLIIVETVSIGFPRYPRRELSQVYA